MRRSLVALLAALMLAALVPSAALAAKPQPLITVNCSDVVASSLTSWSVSGTASWTGQPGGTTALPYAKVVHMDGTTSWVTMYYDSSYTTVPGKTGSMTINNVWITSSYSWVAPGDTVYLGIYFIAKNGTWKGFNETMCSSPLPYLT